MCLTVCRSAGPEGQGGCFDSPSLGPLDSLPTRNDQGVSPWTQKAEGRSGRLAEKALYCALEEIAHRFFRAPAARRSDFVCAPCGRAFSPLSVTAQSAVTPPPRGEASVPASITTKFVVRQSHKKVRLTTKFPAVHGRALGSPSGRAGAERLRGEPRPRAGEVPPQAAKRAKTENKMHKYTKQLHKNPKYTLAPEARNRVQGLKIKKRKQKPKNSKSGLDTGGGYAIMLLKGKGPSFQPVLGLYLLYTIRRKNSL